VILSTTSIGYSQNANESSPYLALPSASVRITSDFIDGSSNVRSILVGGNTSLGSTSTTTNLQLRNALSWISMDGLHKLTLTTELARNLSTTDQRSNLFGSFSFNSLADFEAGRPSSFSRTLSPRRQGRSQGTLGISLGDAWRPNPDLNLTYGVRIDASRFGSGPEFNPLVQQVFGLRNDRVPNPITISPRVGFNKSFGEAPQIAIGDGFTRGPRQRVAGGIGIFQGSPAQSLMNRVISNTGLPSAIQQLTCVGEATPTPDWEKYRVDPSSVPSACADGTGATVFANAQPGVTLVDPGYQASRRLSADLNWNGWVLRNRFNLSVAGSYALNLDQQGEIDLNFAPTQRFVLADEAGRPVYVQPTSIVPQPARSPRATRACRRTSHASRSSTRICGRTQSRSCFVCRRRPSTRSSRGTRATRAPGTVACSRASRARSATHSIASGGTTTSTPSIRFSSTSITICSTRSG
jgi:hypothetical protein